VFDKLQVVRTERSECRATPGQEYFFHLERRDPDPRAFAHATMFFLDGALDRPCLTVAIEAVVARHPVYRTQLELRGDAIMQHARAAAPFRVEQLERTETGDAERRAACEAIIRDRAAFEEHLIRAVVVGFAPDRHVMILIIHHVVNDGGSLEALVEELFAAYGRLRAGQPAFTAPPELAYLDYAAALEAWGEGPAGAAQRARWSAMLAGATPLALPVDQPRDEWDGLRAAAPAGIVPGEMHPIHRASVPAPTLAAIAALARRERTSAFAVYLGALGALLRELSGQDDVAIESSYSPRFNLRLHRQLRPIQGLLTAWTIARLDLANAHTLADHVQRARHTTNDLQELGVIWDYYRIAPVGLRRAVFNYVPMLTPAQSEPAPGLTVTRASPSFPIWKRPWELHLTVIDGRSATQLFWTCNRKLFDAGTVQRWFDAYLGWLGRAAS
jgi:condensation domain-containing protein